MATYNAHSIKNLILLRRQYQGLQKAQIRTNRPLHASKKNDKNNCKRLHYTKKNLQKKTKKNNSEFALFFFCSIFFYFFIFLQQKIRGQCSLFAFFFLKGEQQFVIIFVNIFRCLQRAIQISSMRSGSGIAGGAKLIINFKSSAEK